MSAPTMTWAGTADPDAPGKATLTVGTATLEVQLTSYRDATILHELLLLAYRTGQAGGRRAAAQLVAGVLEGLR